MAANGSALLQAARNLDSRSHLADTPSWNSALTQMRVPPLISTTFSNISGCPGPRVYVAHEYSLNEPCCTCKVAIADTPTLYEQRSCMTTRAGVQQATGT